MDLIFIILYPFQYYHIYNYSLQNVETGNAYEEDSVLKFLSYPSLAMEKGIIKPVLTVNVSQSF